MRRPKRRAKRDQSSLTFVDLVNHTVTLPNGQKYHQVFIQASIYEHVIRNMKTGEKFNDTLYRLLGYADALKEVK